MLSDNEKKKLAPYVTNTEKDIFALKNLPEVVKGALFSRYSRSSLSLKELLLNEFLNNKEVGLVQEKIEKEEESEINRKKAEEFYDRILVGYGDDSVAELAFAHLACENVSMLASKMIEDARIGLSPLEKSTRYVYYNQKMNGKWLYYEEPVLMQSKFSSQYIELMNLLFETYSKRIEDVKKYIVEKYPLPENTSERAYESTVRAKVCDILRGILPSSTLTNLGLAGNGRAYEYLIVRMRASKLTEFQNIAKEMHDELSKIIPSFVKRSFSKHGEEFAEYLKNSSELCLQKAPKEQTASQGVSLISIDGEEEKVLAGLLYEHSKLPFSELLDYVKKLPTAEKEALAKDLFSARKNRRHRPPRAFELINLTFEIIGNYGIFRDLHRHRVLTQMRQRLDTRLGYKLPRELVELGYDAEFKELMADANDLFMKIEKEFPNEAQYCVPMAYNIRWLFHMNLREAFHLCELRSTKQAHIDYRNIAIEMQNQIKERLPLLGKMGYMDFEGADLERLESERRIDKKLEEIKKKYSG